MFATKETAIIAYAAMAGAAFLGAVMARKIRLSAKPLLIAFGCAGLVAFVLFSSFFTNFDGPLQSILAFKGYLARGSGTDTGHVHPWNFYLAMLLRPEGLAFGLGWVGIVSILWKKLPDNCDLGLARFLMFYTLLLTLAYSVLPYKTPWCILSFLQGWILLAGIGVAALFGAAQRGKMPRLLLAIPLLIGMALTAKQARRLVFRQATDSRNPYAYVQTSFDFKNLLRRINELEAVSTRGQGMYIQVIASPDSIWPLPFYLRKFPNTGYWINAADVPLQPRPDLIISAPEFPTHPTEYLVEFYGLRPDTPLALHIDSTLWNTFLETRQ
jgi:predicted membrane-bound mannosyltransferase